MFILVAVTIFLSAFVQTLAGFGSALVAMSVLPLSIGIKVAAPLVALMAITLEITLLLRYRVALNVQAVWRMSLASILGIPIGLSLALAINERIVLMILGAILIVYSLYAALSPRLPELNHNAWAFVFGFIGGILSGAYNVAGPAAVIYGNCRRWSPDEFKSNLQGYFLLNDSIVLISHALAGNLQPIVWKYYLIALPAALVGVFLGFKLNHRIEPNAFRRMVQILLIVMGARLLLS